MRRKIRNILIFLVLFVAAERFAHFQTAGFRMEKILNDLPPGDLPPLTLEEEKAISQPFTYLGCGAQCYAFMSADQTTILKLFKHFHTEFPSEFFQNPPALLDSWCAEILDGRKRRIDRIYDSIKVAFQEHAAGTGITYLHLNRTMHLQKKITLIDKIGNAHEIDLDTTPFLLQKKGELVKTYLNRKIEQGDLDGAKQAVASLIDLIASRCMRGIANNDPLFHRNFGFAGDLPIEIDVGSFSSNKTQSIFQNKQEFFHETYAFKEWIHSNFPLLETTLDEKMAAHLDISADSLRP